MSRKMVAFYREQVARHGNDVRSLAWGSRASQELRFKVFTELFPLQGARVLDLGCGLGDFLSYLKRRRIRVEFTGVDMTPEMVRQARLNHPGARFLVGDLRDAATSRLRADYVFASGIFNYRIGGHRAWMWRTIAAMHRAARRGMAFNVMSRRAPFKYAENHYEDPGECLDRCLDAYPRAVLRHDYMEHDFTIAVPKR